MQSTINLALSNAFAKLNLSPAAADKVIHKLWNAGPQPVSEPPAPVTPPRVVPNIEKLNRQQAQKLETFANGSDVRLLHKNFLAYANSLTPAYFKSQSLMEHMDMYFAPIKSVAPVIPEEDEDEDLVEISYHLRTYDVGVTTHRVYEMRGGVHVFVGMLGMNEFEKMRMPTV